MILSEAQISMHCPFHTKLSILTCHGLKGKFFPVGGIDLFLVQTLKVDVLRDQSYCIGSGCV